MKNCCVLYTFTLFLITNNAFAQTTDSIKVESHFSGSVSATNNGISIVPSFSLGKPAAILMLSMGRKRWSFDPDLRFSLTGKPWSFLFWGRYKIATGDKFKMHSGTHLGLNFRTSVLPINGDTSEVTIARRYLAGELYPRFQLTKNISVGIYYLFSKGLDAGTIGYTHFVTFNTNFSHIPLSKQIYLKINPQFYYLQLDEENGWYVTSTFTLAKKDFPLSLSAIFNQTLQSNITGNKNLVWNVGLVYGFEKK